MIDAASMPVGPSVDTLTEPVPISLPFSNTLQCSLLAPPLQSSKVRGRGQGQCSAGNRPRQMPAIAPRARDRENNAPRSSRLMLQ